MPRPWNVIDTVATPDGVLELRQAGDRDFLILHDGAVLMSSVHHRSEDALANRALPSIASVLRPRVLVSGLGLGYTLRAALDALPSGASVVVAELNPEVVRWCRGPVSVVCGNVLGDKRVEVVVGDVLQVIAKAAKAGTPFDAILIDLYLGPDGDTRDRARGDNHPLYGLVSLQRMWEALTPGGVVGVWGEKPDPRFLERMEVVGFTTDPIFSSKKGPRNVVYVGRRAKTARHARGASR
jgi:spermidine synthase